MDPQATQPHPSATEESDHLAAAVLRSLSRSFYNQFSIGPGRALGISLITFGLYPLWKLTRQLSDYSIFERQHFWHLAEWVRLRRGSDEALALHSMLRPSRASQALTGLIITITLLTALAIFGQMDGEFSLNRLIDNTFGFRHPRLYPTDVWKTWIIGLGVAYVLLAVRVGAYHHATARFVDRFNALMRRENLPYIVMPHHAVGARGGWVWTAIILSWFGAFWSIPMCIAAAMQRRYVNVTAMRLRADMLARFRSMLEQHKPPVAVPNYVIHNRRCGNDLCQATLRAGAEFCSRCGTSAQRMSEVA